MIAKLEAARARTLRDIEGAFGFRFDFTIEVARARYAVPVICTTRNQTLITTGIPRHAQNGRAVRRGSRAYSTILRCAKEEAERRLEQRCPFCGCTEPPEENEAGWPQCVECRGV